MTEAQAIAKQLGGVKPDDEWLQAEIARLKGKSIVPLQQVKTLNDWLDGKRKARKSCRVVGESRTGKTVACDAYRYRHKPQQEAGRPPTVPVVYIRPHQKCGPKDLFKKITEYLKYRVTKGTVSSNLKSKEMLRILTSATEGYIGRLDEILREAAIRSLSRGLKKIDKAVLQEVAKEYK